jgi:C-terminal processing protease CtpA/Prc
MRKLFVFPLSMLLVACGSDSSITGPPAPTSCSNDGQKQFVLDALYDWYLWNDILPADIDVGDYTSPEELVYEVTRTYGPQDANGNPIDRWSRIGTVQADQQFYGEGKYEGFGFRWRFEGPDMRIVSVYQGSPAELGGLERGQTVISLNGQAVASIGATTADIGAFISASDSITFEVQDVQGAVLPLIVATKDIVTIDPIPQVRVIDVGPGAPPVGYMQFETFISTAHDGQGGRDFNDVFAQFIAAGVRDVILDLRYNRGGLVDTAELLGDYLGGFANDNLIFSRTEFNADRADNNTESRFARLGNSIDLTRVIVIASRDNTASASELVANAMIPYADVWIVGENTYGKPVGQVAIDFCEKRLRPISFKTTNANGDGDYFGGLPVDCAATDDLDIPIGDDLDENIIAATTISSTGACPVIALPGGQQAPVIRPEIRYPELIGPPEREFAGSF